MATKSSFLFLAKHWPVIDRLRNTNRGGLPRSWLATEPIMNPTLLLVLQPCSCVHLLIPFVSWISVCVWRGGRPFIYREKRNIQSWLISYCTVKFWMMCLTKQALRSVACNSTDSAPLRSWLGNKIHWVMLKTLTYRPPQASTASTSNNILIKKQKRPQQNLQRPKTKQKIKHLCKYAWKHAYLHRCRVCSKQGLEQYNFLRREDRFCVLLSFH